MPINPSVDRSKLKLPALIFNPPPLIDKIESPTRPKIKRCLELKRTLPGDSNCIFITRFAVVSGIPYSTQKLSTISKILYMAKKLPALISPSVLMRSTK